MNNLLPLLNLMKADFLENNNTSELNRREINTVQKFYDYVNRKKPEIENKTIKASLNFISHFNQDFSDKTNISWVWQSNQIPGTNFNHNLFICIREIDMYIKKLEQF